MAETIRYDTSEDPVAAQAVAEAEAESLKVGEELMAKQNKMLAGKYKSVDELEKLSTDAFLQTAMRDQTGGQIAIAYTVWSKKKGGGKLIVKEVFKKIKKSNHLNRLVTLSPLTEMATNFHERNGAKLIQVNENTQNFEYKIM